MFLGIAGYLFFIQLFMEKQAHMRPLFTQMPLLFTFLVPAVCMRLLAEEKGSGTLMWLVTMPVKDWEIVAGKFLAALALLGTILGLTLTFAATVASLGTIDVGATVAGYLGIALLAAACASISLMASSWASNQIVAFLVGWAICFTLWLFGRIAQVVPATLKPLVNFLSLRRPHG